MGICGQGNYKSLRTVLSPYNVASQLERSIMLLHGSSDRELLAVFVFHIYEKLMLMRILTPCTAPVVTGLCA